MADFILLAFSACTPHKVPTNNRNHKKVKNVKNCNSSKNKSKKISLSDKRITKKGKIHASIVYQEHDIGSIYKTKRPQVLMQL